MNLILSIKPEYVKAILSGEKKYEFRRRIFKRPDIEKIYIYCSSPTKMIVAVFHLNDIIEDSPQGLWDRLKDKAGLTKEEFFDYFQAFD